MSGGSMDEKKSMEVQGMKMRERFGRKACALALGGVLATGCLLAGCSGSGEAQAEDSLSVEPATIEKVVVDTDAAQQAETTATAMVMDHWSATLEGEGVSLAADVDVPALEKSAYPARQTSQMLIGQDMVDKVLALVAPDAQFTVDDFTMTKADIQREIESIQACLEEGAASGDKTWLEAEQHRLEELQAQLQSAPDAVEERVWDGRLYTDDALANEAPYASVTSREPDGTCRLFAAQTMDPSDPAGQQYLYYAAADYMTEEADRSSSGEDGDPGTPRRLALYAENGMDEEVVVRQLAQTLSSLGVPGVEATSVDKALWAPRRELTDEQAAAMKEEPASDELSSHALYVDFAVGADGLTGLVPGDSGLEDGAPVTPYDAMTGSALVAEDGTILQLSISGSGLIGDAEGEGEAIHSLPELQDKIVDVLAQATGGGQMEEMEAEPDPAAGAEPAGATPAAEPAVGSSGLAYTVDKARLGYALVGDPDNPDAAKAVPAWEIQVSVDDADAMFSALGLVVSAVDGEPILRASSRIP